jgi:capsular exopolysaccharide synthesis family protein
MPAMARARPVTQSSFGESPFVVPVPQPAPAEAVAAAPGLSAAPTVTGLLAALRRRLLLAVALATAGAALAVTAVVLLVPARYVAQTRVRLVSRPNDPVVMPELKVAEEPTIWKANQEGILKSPVVLDRALRTVREKGLSASYSVGYLETALKVDFLQGPEIMRVTLTGDDGESLAALLNAIVDSYLTQVRQEEIGRRNVISKELGATQAELTDKRRKATDALKKEQRAQQYDPARAKLDAQLALDREKEFDKILQQTKSDLAKKQRELRVTEGRVENIKNEPIPQEELDKEFRKSLAVLVLEQEIKGYDDTILQIQQLVKEDQQAVQLRGPLASKAKALRKLNKLLEDLQPAAEARVRTRILENLKAFAAQMQIEVDSLKQQTEDQLAHRKKLQDEVKRLDPANLPRTSLMERLENEIDQYEQALANVNKQMAKLRVEPVAAERAQILQRAAAPDERDHSRQIKIAGAAGIGVFGLLLFGVGLVEFRSRKVNSADEVAQGLGLNVLGTLPALPARLRRPVPGSARPRDLQIQNQMTEAVDAVRTLLLHQSRTQALQVVMVTSPGGGEGKTSLASQLAASLARAWRKTLLVDGDLRNPAAHRLFDVPLEPGLSEVLRGEVKAGDVVRPTPLSRLWMVPAGHWDSHAVQALAQDGVRALFTQLKSEYEFIIVDSCPVLPVADSLLLGQHVDAVILSVLRDVSRLPAVHAAHQRFNALGVRTLGAVVIGAASDVPAMAYQYPQPNA